MLDLPRLAVGAVQPPEAGRPSVGQAMLLALQATIRRHDLAAHLLASQAHHCHTFHSLFDDPPGQLDSWTMSRSFAARHFERGVGPADLAIATGQYDVSRIAAASDCGGSLDTLCDWFSLPRFVVVDASRIHPCHIPAPPHAIDGVLIEGASNLHHACKVRTMLEAAWRAPVLAMLTDEAPEVHAARTSTAHDFRLMDRSALADALYGDVDRIVHVANGASPFPCPNAESNFPSAIEGVNIGVAMDEVFSPSKILWEELESAGAILREFSPLHDCHFPDNCELLLLTDASQVASKPQSLTDEALRSLATNGCMRHAMHAHVYRGKTVVGLGAGFHYLGQQHLGHSGLCYEMCGLLPVVTATSLDEGDATPVEQRIPDDCKFLPGGMTVRGYANSSVRVQSLLDDAPSLGLAMLGPMVGSPLMLCPFQQLQLIHGASQPHLAMSYANVQEPR